MSKCFEYTKKKYSKDEYSAEVEDEDLEQMEEDISTALFREMCSQWLEANGLRIILEEVNAKPRPRYRRQNAKANIEDEH